MKNIEKWSWIYAVLRFMPWVFHRIIHHEIKVIGLENIPKDKPVIFAPNHQNALMDAMALVFTSPKQIVFLARADIFRKKIIASILYNLKLMPVYRIRDGKDNLVINEKIFNKSIDILLCNKVMCLFPEAAHSNARSMLPHKKAVARIAFLAGQKTNFDIDLQVVPVGITFSHYFRFRRRLLIHYGKPIAVKPFFDLMKDKGEHFASIQLRNTVYNKIDELIVNIKSRDDLFLFESAFTLYRQKIAKGQQLNKGIEGHLQADRFLMGQLSKRFEQNLNEKQWLAEKITLLNAQCKNHHLNIELFSAEATKPMSAILLILITLIAWPIVFFGLMVNGCLFYYTQYASRKKIRDPQFYSSFAFGLSVILFPIWYLIVGIIVQLAFGKFLLTAFVIIFAPVSGILVWGFINEWRKSRQQMRLNHLRKNRPSTFEEIQNVSNEIISFLDKTIS